MCSSDLFVAMPDVATAYWTGEAENDLALSGVGLGDVNGDGSADVAIESPRAGAGGVVFIDLGPLAGGDSVAFVDLAVRGGSTSYSFGLAASVGDLDGDGSDDLAVGDYSDTSAGEDAGAVWVFTGLQAGTYDTDDAAGSWVGGPSDELASVVGVGDTDGDGAREVLAGALGADTVATAGGAAALLEW